MREPATADVVRCLVAEQFPEWADLPVTPVEHDGWDNTTFRLGDALSVRLPSADWYTAQVDKEHRWLPVLAPYLPLPIPRPVAKGEPGCGFPRPWSVYAWLPGRHATVDRVADLTALATDLAAFLTALYAIPPAADAPPPGKHSALRGAPPAVLDEQTRDALAALAGEVDTVTAAEVWEAALASEWDRPPVWFHGDLSATNVLVRDGRLSAVIDFGMSAVGDPACDLAIAWTFLHGDSRAAFRTGLDLDAATWARGRGWMLWKALITLAEARAEGPEAVAVAGLRFGWRQPAAAVVADVLADHREHG